MTASPGPEGNRPSGPARVSATPEGRISASPGRSAADAAGRTGSDRPSGSDDLGEDDASTTPEALGDAASTDAASTEAASTDAASTDTDFPEAAPTDADRAAELGGLTELGGTEHLSALLEWRPSYQHEVAVVGWLRHVSYGDGSEDTPAAVLRIENPEDPGEIAMTADDLAALAERLLDLHRVLCSTHREGLIPGPRTDPDDG